MICRADDYKYFIHIVETNLLVNSKVLKTRFIHLAHLARLSCSGFVGHAIGLRRVYLIGASLSEVGKDIIMNSVKDNFDSLFNRWRVWIELRYNALCIIGSSLAEEYLSHGNTRMQNICTRAITLSSYWPRWRLKSRASRLFTWPVNSPHK